MKQNHNHKIASDIDEGKFKKSRKRDLYLVAPEEYDEHSNAAYDHQLIYGIPIFIHRHRLVVFFLFFVGHYALHQPLDIKIYSILNELGVNALQAHFYGVISILGTFPLIMLLMITPYFLGRSNAFLAAIPILLAWVFSVHQSFSDHWGFGCGFWLAMSLTTWTMKVIAFLALSNKNSSSVFLSNYLIFLFFSPSLVYDYLVPRRKISVQYCLVEFFFAFISFGVCHVIALFYLTPILRQLWETSLLENPLYFIFQLFLIAIISHPLQFFGFYGFWHCLGGGFAHLSGHSDHYIYGPWWLYDHPASFFVNWSRPVHIWLKNVIHNPLKKQFGTAVAGCAAFTVSSFLHEIILFTSFRRIWPISSFNLLLAAVLIPLWNTLFGHWGVLFFRFSENLGHTLFVISLWRCWLAEFGEVN